MGIELKEEGINLYASLQNYIISQINEGTFAPGASLPTEKWFTDNFNVSRITVRKALNNLIREGVIEKEKGKSPIVPIKRYNRDFNRLTGFSEQMFDEGHIPSSKLIEFKTIKCPEQLCSYMKLQSGEEITYIKRIRLSDGNAMVLQEIFLNKRYSHFLTKNDLEYKSLYSILESKGVALDYCEQKIMASMPTAEQKNLLNIDNKTAVFLMNRITYHKNGDVIEYVKSCCDSNKYNITIKLYR